MKAGAADVLEWDKLLQAEQYRCEHSTETFREEAEHRMIKCIYAHPKPQPRARFMEK